MDALARVDAARISFGVVRKGTVIATALMGGMIGLAGTASADPLEGSYIATVTGSFGQYLGGPAPTWVLTPCGPDCVNVSAQGAVLHPNGAGGWQGTFEVRDEANGEVVVCTRAISPDLAAADVCPKPLQLMVNYQLTKA